MFPRMPIKKKKKVNGNFIEFTSTMCSLATLKIRMVWHPN